MSTNTTPKRQRTLKSLFEDNLIDMNAQCYFIYNGVDYPCSIVVSNTGVLSFKGKAIGTGVEVIEHASTTFIRRCMSLPAGTAVDGNNLMYINGKRITDYQLTPRSSPTSNHKGGALKLSFEEAIAHIASQLSNVQINNTGNPMGTPTRSPYTSPPTTPGTPLSPPSDGTRVPKTPPSIIAPSSRFLRSDLNQPKLTLELKNTSPIKIEFDLNNNNEASSNNQEISNQSDIKTIEPARIKASGLGRYFHFNCHRYLSWSTRESYRPSNPQIDNQPPTTIAEAIRREGFNWETKVLEFMEAEKYKIEKPKGNLTAIPYVDTIKLLKETNQNSYLFQCILEAPPTFRKDLPEAIKFSISIPDYLKITIEPGRTDRKLKILDAKSTTHINFSQKLQLAYYYIWLEQIIKVENIPNLKLDEFASIYLKGKSAPTDFAIGGPVSVLKRFLYGDNAQPSLLVSILSVDKMSSPWTLTESCDGCDYLEKCTDQANREQSRNCLPFILPDTFNGLLGQQTINITDIDNGKVEIIEKIEKTEEKVEKIENVEKIEEKVESIEKKEKELAVQPIQKEKVEDVVEKENAQPIQKEKVEEVVEVVEKAEEKFEKVEKKEKELDAQPIQKEKVEDVVEKEEKVVDVEKRIEEKKEQVVVVEKVNAQPVQKEKVEKTEEKVVDVEKIEEKVIVQPIQKEKVEQQPKEKLTDLQQLDKIKIELVLDPLAIAELKKLKPRVESYLTNRIIPTGYVNVAYPSYEDISLYLSLTYHPIKQELYKWSILHVDGSTNKSIFTFGDEFKQLITFLEYHFNLVSKSNTLKSIQLFIWDIHEKNLFFRLCYSLLKSTEENSPLYKSIINVLLVVLDASDWINFNIGNLYPHLPFSYQKDSTTISGASPTPILVMKDNILKSLAIKLSPPYTLAKVAMAVLKLESIPNSLSSDYIFTKVIMNNETDTPIFKERLDLLWKLNYNFRYTVFNGDFTKQVAPTFKARSPIQYNTGILNKLLFCHQFESYETFKELRNLRSNPIDVNVYEGKYLILTKSNGEYGQFQTDILYHHYGYLEQRLKDKFAYFSMVENSDHGIKTLLQFNDLRWYGPNGPPNQCDVTYVEFTPIKYNINGTIKVNILLRSKGLLQFKNNTSYILFERYDNSYFTQYKYLIKSYDEIDSETNSNLKNLFFNPLEWTKEDPLPKINAAAVGRTILAFQETNNKPGIKLSLTPSQLVIFENVVKKRLQLVVGPPGTGKTHFLALTVLILMETFIRTGKPFTIAITAFTHTAIDNLLIRIAELKKEYEREYAGKSLNFIIAKKETILSPVLSNLDIVSTDSLKKKPQSLLCFGSTCWGINSLHHLTPDLLIIDEASQLPTPIAALAINKAPHIIVCGDPKQLPPITHGEYLINKDYVVNHDRKEPKTYKSIFSCLKSLLVQNGVKTPYLTLNENFRMSMDLCQFSAANIYGPSYQCFTKEAKQAGVRNLEETKNLMKSDENSIIKAIYGDTRSCITVLVDDQHFGERDVEVEMVRLVYKYEFAKYKNNYQQLKKLKLQARLDAGKITKVEMDKLLLDPTSITQMELDFWADRQLGIITPLNIQRVGIAQMISYEQGLKGCLLDVKPSVGTVERTQGQEFETVVVCYNGWSHSGKAVDFIFNLNRLNVSFTRSKQKLILIICNKLLHPNQAILNNPKISRAYFYLLEYQRYSSVYQVNVIKLPSSSIQKTSSTTTTTTSNTKSTTPLQNNSVNNNPTSPIDAKQLQQDFINKLNLHSDKSNMKQ